MRLAMYAGTSAALAVAVVTSAFWQRANFYSAMVYLSQSNLCLMILVNLVFLAYGSFMYGLQRLCFGTLRPVEVEQLYEKAWFAVTETCLAMTVFREEVGAFFLVMFTALITGKVWGWIAEGRVEVLEQQPPANPRLFHTRLVVSLVASVAYNCWLLSYSIATVIAVAKPTMMVMFLFEFAVLVVGSIHTALRYVISLVEASVVRKQTRHRLRQRRAEVGRERDEILRRREAGELPDGEGEPLPDPDEVEEMDIEVPGWEAKGQWVLFLDLFADFLKLSVYVAFFGVLLRFYGLPIHIMRDLFMTARSFVKRLSALLKYKQALRDMNRYPDASEDELGNEDTCIICREEMRPWDPGAGQLERHRPKKLPCGHVLHFGCLKSWLERQQVCPTCRSSVVADQQRPPYRHRMAFHIAPNNGQNHQAGAADGAPPLGVQAAQLNGQAGQGGQQPAAPRNVMRYINLGPIRLGFAQGGQEVAELANRMGVDINEANLQRAAQQAHTPVGPPPADLSSMEAVRVRLLEVDQRLRQEIRDLQDGMNSVHAAQEELHLINHLHSELLRLRQARGQDQPPQQQEQQQQQQQQPEGQQQQQHTPPAQNGQTAPTVAVASANTATAAGGSAAPHMPPPPPMMPHPPPHPPPMMGGGPPPWNPFNPYGPYFVGHPPPPQLSGAAPPLSFRMSSPPNAIRHHVPASATTIPAGSPDLPEGVVLPAGWSLLPLQRLDQAAIPPQVQGFLHPSARANHPQDPTQQTTTPRPSFQWHDGPAEPAATAGEDGAPSPSQDASEPVVSTTQGPAAGVAAPTPVVPHWGGSAQLFGGGGGGGSGRNDSSSSASPAATGVQHQTETATQPAAAADEETKASESGPSASSSSSAAKGKGPVPATAEDVDDDES